MVLVEMPGMYPNVNVNEEILAGCGGGTEMRSGEQPIIRAKCLCAKVKNCGGCRSPQVEVFCPKFIKLGEPKNKDKYTQVYTKELVVSEFWQWGA